MTPEQLALWEDLWAKYTALTAWEQKFNLIVPVDQRPDYEGFLSAIQAEIQQVNANMNFLLNGASIPFPSDQQIADLRAATGMLAVAVANSNHVNQLLGSVTTVLNSWPVSSAG